jgi:superfamily II DNA or RNA helicase
MRNYDKSIFSDFGLVIYDECHHLCAKTFSKCMMKLRIPYTLGLSATPNRKDKLENLIYYFLGDIMYQDKMDDNEVNIKLYNYNFDDYEKRKFINIDNCTSNYKYDIKVTNLVLF